MSRIGRAPVVIPAGVTVDRVGDEIRVKGPKGTLVERMPEEIDVKIENSEVVFGRPDDQRDNRALHGLARALVANMVHGVTKSFVKELEIQGVGYRAEAKGRQVVFALGYSHPVVFDIPQGIDVAVTNQTHITVTGVDRQLVGQVAANIRQLRRPDPYKQKGVRYTGEVLKKKVGKTGA